MALAITNATTNAAATASVQFRIPNFSQQIDQYIQSDTFDAGGHDWCIRCFPSDENFENHVSFQLALVSGASVGVDVMCYLRAMDATTGALALELGCSYAYFSEVDCRVRMSETSMSRDDMASMPFVRDDCLAVQCTVTVISAVGAPVRPKAPPPDMREHLVKLLQSEEIPTDVTFEVDGEKIRAYRMVLAARSPVFRAELYGPMAESNINYCIKIDDMEASVFKAMLHYAYTDELPETELMMSSNAMLQKLLVAADRYAVDRLKAICEEKLCRGITVDTVVTTLILAVRHSICHLKDACLEFLSTNSESMMLAMLRKNGFARLKKSCPSALTELEVKVGKSSMSTMLLQSLHGSFADYKHVHAQMCCAKRRKPKMRKRKSK